MGYKVVLPILFGILFFGTVFSAQDVYGPHYTTFDGVSYDFQGSGIFMTYNISDGLSNPKKSANFEVCVTLEKVTDSTIPTEIVALDLVSCQPITIIGDSDQKNFLLAETLILTDGPLSSSSGFVDIFGFYEIVNPAGKSMAGETIIDARNVEVDTGPLVCTPTSCEDLGLADCSGTCRDTNTDESNCGACLTTCNSGEVCSAGSCSLSCQSGLTNCGGTCVDTNTDESNCGANPTTCSGGTVCSSGEICNGAGVCALSCQSGLTNCSGICVNTNTDESNCGADPATCSGGTACLSGEFCVNGTCEGGSSCTSSPEVCDGIDNDCDGAVDEDFASLGTVCSAGLGTCQSLGTIVCNASQDATECSATAGIPETEVCNGLDDDCDGTVDDIVPPLCPLTQGVCSGARETCSGTGGFSTCDTANYGADYQAVETACDGLDNDCDGAIDDVAFNPLCSTQLGVCASSTQTCSGSSGFQTCGATEFGSNYESVETTCDGLDNDCDGAIDDGFLNGGKYNQDTACGSCFTDCTAIFDKPNAFGTCDSTTTPVCQLTCSSGFVDADGNPSNGCEFSENTNAIHVSKTGSDSGSCGPIADTCATISHGIVRATADGKTEVHVASGFYQESITLVNGINLRGGYNPVTWTQDSTINVSIIQGDNTGTHKKAIIASGITSSTVFDGFSIFGQNNPNSNGNSYAFYIIGSTSDLEISNNKIFAGRGGDGIVGSNGMDGSDGADGNNGVAGFENNDNSLTISGGLGGGITCSGDNVSGGNGGDTQGPFTFATETSTDGSDGEASTGAGGSPGGAGGDAGDNGELRFSGGSVACFLPSDSTDASSGSNGVSGTNGGGGSACTLPSGTVSGNEWVGISGVNGIDGSNGSGGGGGGAGSGSESTFDNSVRYGVSGAGGGGGACGGSGGLTGTAGGGSFGIFTLASVPSISNNEIYLGSGGAGGSGGHGGVGGLGALGGVSNSDPLFCAGSGGNGANGGDGGHGSGSGGSCGGASYGIYSFGGPSTTSWSSENTFFTIGTPGPGGSGGLSLGNSGAAGQTGTQADTSFS